MEPDEAVDALRDLSSSERNELLELMPAATADQLGQLLHYREDRAGGFMTSTLVRATGGDTVGQLRTRLAAIAEHGDQVDAVAVLDEDGYLLADLALFDLFVADDTVTVGDLVTRLGQTQPLTVDVDLDVDAVAARLIDSRRSSLVVVDDQGRPVGRIMADDVLDALRAGESRLHFPRLLS